MSKKVEIVKGIAFEIDPTKRYILIFDKYELSKKDASTITQQIKEWGAEGIGIVIGNPQNLKVIEL